MAYDAILDNELTVGKPTKRSLWLKVKGNFDFLFGRSNPEGLLNGSFEYDTDADGIPDNWTRTLLAGGSSGIDTTNPQHGGKCLYFTHPGGAGNGGGYADSDYVECSELESSYLEFTIKSTASGIHNLVEIYFYDKAKVYISTGTAHNANSPDTAAHYYTYQFMPPANARYFKVRVLGGQVDVNQAGTVYFDGVRVEPLVMPARIHSHNAGAILLASNDAEKVHTAGTRNAYVEMKKIKVYRGGSYRIKYDAHHSADDPTYTNIFRNNVNTPVGTERGSPLPGTYTTYSQDISGWVVGDEIIIAGKIGTGSGGDAIYVQNFRIYVGDPPNPVNTLE